jgi:hypothetical protein
MARLYIDGDKYAAPNVSATVEAFHSAIRDLVRTKLDAAGGDWNAFVFDRSYTLLTAKDLEGVEKLLTDAGHRFDWSAVISVRERPEIYKPGPGAADPATFSFEHKDAVTAPADAEGREQRGVGDNVVRYETTTRGIARYVRTSERVLAYLTNGVPPDTIAIIDDSGGTLTAPILEQFHGVICAGGSTRSHLGILTREYGIPCFMNAKISGIREGDLVEMETTAPAKTAEAYQKGIEMTGRVWKRTR